MKEDVARLREQLAGAKKNSSTSSKPPSSDIVKAKLPDETDGAKRKIGGQPGHPMHAREPFGPEEITRFHEHPLDACPSCGGQLQRNGSFARVVQQMDIQAVPLTIEGHFTSGAPVPLFQASGREQIAGSELVTYDVTKDGQRFLINTQLESAETRPMMLVLNWRGAVEK